MTHGSPCYRSIINLDSEMELVGKVKVIFDEKSFASGFTKREFVITTEEQYPNDIMFELLKEKGAMVNGLKSGDRVNVKFDIRGREWQGKYFNSLVAWKVEAVGATAAPQDDQLPPPPMESYNDPIEDDLPF
ncbi:MAG: hypothetical protein RL204_1438 [Bacteroidota bacterium]